MDTPMPKTVRRTLHRALRLLEEVGPATVDVDDRDLNDALGWLLTTNLDDDLQQTINEAVQGLLNEVVL